MRGPARPTKRRAPALSAAALVLALGASCASSSSSGPPLPPQPPQVDLIMSEMRFDFAENLPRGRVVFKLRNAGRAVHRAALVFLPEDVPPILQQLRGSERLVVDELASVPNRPPGSTDSFAVNLDRGRWAFLCLVIDADGKSHAEKGMAAEFRVA